MTDDEAVAILRDCAEHDSRLFFSKHAEERMLQRKITRLQVMTCLTKGKVVESAYRDPKGDFRLTLEHYTAGSIVTAAVAIKLNDYASRTVVVTVY
jgi:hypothetical protein